MLYSNRNEILSAVLDEPSAPSILAELESILIEERKKRIQFYQEIDDETKAEFINGDIIVHSPVKKEHTDAVGLLYTLMNLFVRIHKLGYVGYEKVMSAFGRNDYEPDVVFFDISKSQHFKPGIWKYPPPDLVVEVLSESTESRDRGVKFKDYQAHGVKEYWIIDTSDSSIEQYILKNDKYELYQKLHSGEIESQVINGFKIPVLAVFDEEVNLKALKNLLL